MSTPLTIASLCSRSFVPEFLLHKRSLERWHACTWVLATDAWSHAYLTRRFDNVHAEARIVAEGTHQFDDAASNRRFRELIAHKLTMIGRAMDRCGYGLFLDSDMLFLRPLGDDLLDARGGPWDVVACDHHFPADDERQRKIDIVGRYNVGMLVVNSRAFLDAWTERTARADSFYEQKPFEALIDEGDYAVLEAPIVYNWGGWRFRYDELVLRDDQICYRDQPIVNFHVHFFQERRADRRLTEHVLGLMRRADNPAYRDLLAAYETLARPS